MIISILLVDQKIMLSRGSVKFMGEYPGLLVLIQIWLEGKFSILFCFLPSILLVDQKIGLLVLLASSHQDTHTQICYYLPLDSTQRRSPQLCPQNHLKAT